MTKQIKPLSGEGIDTKDFIRCGKGENTCTCKDESECGYLNGETLVSSSDYARLESDHKALQEKYNKLYDDNFHLAACQCETPSIGDNGHFLCLKLEQLLKKYQNLETTFIEATGELNEERMDYYRSVAGIKL